MGVAVWCVVGELVEDVWGGWGERWDEKVGGKGEMRGWDEKVR